MMESTIVDTSIVKQERVTPPLPNYQDGTSSDTPTPLVIAPIRFNANDQLSSSRQVPVQNGTNVAMVPPYSEQMLQNPLLSLSIDSSGASTSRRDDQLNVSDGLSTKVTAVDKEGVYTDDEYQAFGFIYRDPLNSAKSYLCNFCNYICVSRKDFMQHSLIHVVQCGSCRFKAFTRLEVIRHTAKHHPNKMHTFDNLQQLNIEWKCKNGASDAQTKTSRTKQQGAGSKSVSSSSKSSSTTRNDVPDNNKDSSVTRDGPPRLTRQDTPTQDRVQNSSMSSLSSYDGDSMSNADFHKAISDSEGLIQWAIEQGLKMPDYVQSILGNSGALISELKYMMRIVKRAEARYGCIACEDFKCNQYVDFKMHMRERHQFPQSKMWECGNCNLKYNTAKDLLRHTKGNHNHPFEQYCVSVRLPWLVETTGSSPVHANQTDPKCGNCDFTVKTSFARYWHRMQPHRRWMQMPDGGTPLHHAAMIWDVIQTRFHGCTVQSCDKIMKIMFGNIDTLTKHWPLSKYYPLSNKSTNIVTWPLTLIDRLKLLCHMKANHPEDWLITVNHQGSNKMMIATRPVRPHSKTKNYMMDANIWNTKGETILEAFGSPEHGSTLALPATQPKSDVVTLVIGEARRMVQSNMISVLKPIQPMSPTSKRSKSNSQVTKDVTSVRQSEETASPGKFVSPLLTAGILPLLPPADYEEPDPALDYIDPQKRELLDLSFQETTMLKNVHGEESVECLVVYYKETAPDLLINHRNHYTSSVGKDGVMCAQCKQCKKTLKGKNSIAHMRDHVASHTGGRLYECAYCNRQALRPGLMCDHVRKMHPNRTLLIVKRKARVTGPVGSSPACSNSIDSLAQHSIPSPEDNILHQDVSSTQQGDEGSPKRQSSSPEKKLQGPRRVILGPKKIIFSARGSVTSAQVDHTNNLANDDQDQNLSSEDEDEKEPPIWKCPYCLRMFEEDSQAQNHISASHAPAKDVKHSVLLPVPELPPDVTLTEMQMEITKLKHKKVPMVTLYRVPHEDPPGMKEELEDVDEEEAEDNNFKSPEPSKKSKRPERIGRSPMMAYIGQLYRERKVEMEKSDGGQKISRPRALPPPHYDHWDLDHVPLKCSQCEFQSTHETVKEHYKAEHLQIFPTAFDLEARHKKKKYTVFICPSSGCEFTTYWREVINHHTKGHRLNRHEIDGLIFKVFGDKIPGNAGGRKRKQNEDENEEASPQRGKKRRKLDKEEKPMKTDELAVSSSYVPSETVFPEPQEVTRTDTVKNSHQSPMKNSAKKPVTPKQKVATNDITATKRAKNTHSNEKAHSEQKKKQTNKVKKGKVVLHRAIKAKRDAIKSSTVTSVVQKGGILRSVQLSKHPVLLNDLKMERAKQTESVFQERYVCPYCTFVCESADPVRKHIDETHKRKDPTVIDRFRYVRKQRCKTFYCWNSECTYQTAVCEERESHTETSKCGAIYEQKFGEPVPKVKEKKTPVSKKSVKKLSVEEQTAVSNNESSGFGDQTEKMRARVLKLFDEHKSQSLERIEILKSLGDFSKDDVSSVLRDMAEESEIVCSGSLVYIV